MLTFFATFARYNSKTTESQISAEYQIRATDFNDAADKANLVIAAWKEVIPNWDTKVVSIRTHDYRGTKFTGYLSVWEDPPAEPPSPAANAV